jgi:nitroreductase
VIDEGGRGGVAAADGGAEPARLIDDLERTWGERRSTRGFVGTPIPRETLRRIFSAAQTAPSWCNVQPWRVCVTEPPLTPALAAELQRAATTTGLPRAEVPFPLDYPSPYKEHRKACGVALYQAMGIPKDDGAGRYAAWLRNYALFDAPHLAVVAADRRLGPYAYIDVGVWLGYVLTAATALGIETCPMASIAAYPEPLRAALPIAETDTILFGLVLGHANPVTPANACRTTREPVDANVIFVGERAASRTPA